MSLANCSKVHTRVAQSRMLLQVQEFFGDFVVLDSQHFCIPLPRPHVVLQPFSWDYANSTDAVTRMTEGLASLTLSLRRRFNIRCAHVCFAGTLHCFSQQSCYLTSRAWGGSVHDGP